MTTKRKPGRPRSVSNSASVRGYNLEKRHLDIIARWRRRRGSSSNSAALREILEESEASTRVASP